MIVVGIKMLAATWLKANSVSTSIFTCWGRFLRSWRRGGGVGAGESQGTALGTGYALALNEARA